MANKSFECFLARLIGDGDFREAFYASPLNACTEGDLGLTWTEMAAVLALPQAMLAEFSRGMPTFTGPFPWRGDTTERVALRAH